MQSFQIDNSILVDIYQTGGNIVGNYAKTKEKFLNMTFTSNNYGDFVVIDYEHCSNVTIRFINTGIVLVTNTTSILSGGVRDPSVKKASGKRVTAKRCKFVGNTYKSNNYGEYIVEEVVGRGKVSIVTGKQFQYL